jgi:chromosome partitioning protein
VPFKPRGFDTWALPKFDEIMRDVLDVHEELEVYALINEADSAGPDNDDALRAVCAFEYMRPLALQIGSRKVIPTASTTGRYVDELRTNKPSVLAACKEIGELVTMIEHHRFAVRQIEAVEDDEV